MSYKPRSLFRIIEEVNRSVFLPHIQRPFVWDEDQMRRLLDSLMRNYPIQTLLFWRTKDAIKSRKFMETVEWDPNLSDFYDEDKSREGVEKVLVLDGQQRIQTLLALFQGGVEGPNRDEKREAYLDLTSGTEIDEDGFLYRVQFSPKPLPTSWLRLADLTGRLNQRNAEEIADDVNDRLEAELAELAEANDDRRRREKLVRRNVAQLVALLREERFFWVQELDGVAEAYPYGTVLDIFVRVNSGGTKLDAGDLMFAAMKEGWDEVEERVEEVAELLNGDRLSFDKTFPLKCLLTAHGKGAELTPKKFTGPDSHSLLDAIKNDWDRAEATFQQLRDFIVQDLRIDTPTLVRSFSSFVPLFDYLFHNPKPDERNRQLMRAYHYKAQLFNWYRARTDNILNAMHRIVGEKLPGGFPMEAIKQFFARNNYLVELGREHINETRLRYILLQLVYVQQFGTGPFDVRFKGNAPHIDHIYPQHGLRTQLGLQTSDVNHLGNYRFVGATDNIRKRGERPASYFNRLKDAQVQIEKHLLLQDMSTDPSLLAWDAGSYQSFRDRRLERIFEIAQSVVNVEAAIVGGSGAGS
ncbi:MAG TPA: DUF262 domain-containing protein [Bacillota bacterium]|nr:DUF262 domain-containing protein [Bacillota bacterium]